MSKLEIVFDWNDINSLVHATITDEEGICSIQSGWEHTPYEALTRLTIATAEAWFDSCKKEQLEKETVV